MADVNLLSLVEPACQIEVPLRSLQDQTSCVKAEVRTEQVAVVVAMVAALIIGINLQFDDEQFDDYGRPIKRALNWKRGLGLTALVGGFGVGVITLTKEIRMAQWRAQKLAAARGVEQPQSANYIQARRSADAAMTIAQATVAANNQKAYGA